jgi:signal transduction histidine kinase
MPFDKHTTDDVFPWSPWVPFGAALIASVAMAAALIQRDPIGSMVRPAIYASIAMTPFLLDALDMLVPFRVALPQRLFPIPVLVGAGLLVSNPAEVDFAPFIFVFLTAEIASRSSDDRLLSIGTLVAANGVMVGLDVFGRYDDSFIWVIGISFGWFGGFLIQSLARRTLELKEAQASLTEKAATDERQRIAREIHDVIAHSMSVTMLHITAARMALERDRSADALEALREAEQQGRNSLNEIRRTVGLLGPDEAAAAPPMPTATDLPKLVSDFRAAGLDVDLSMDGDVPALPPAAGLNLYRIVQESLTNVVKHAPGAKATVELNVTGDDIRLRVRNGTGNGYQQPLRSGGGLGMRGMSERAQMLGGKVDILVGENGWTVQLVAPRPLTA